MRIEVDSNSNKFFRFKNVRVSVKHAKGSDQDWNGSGRYLQILTYRDSTQTGTYPGPQIPIDDQNQEDEEILVIVWRMLKAAT